MTGERHYDFRLSPSLVEAQSLIPPERTTGRRLWKPAVLFEYGKEEGHWVGALIGATQNESAPHYHCVIDIFPVWRRTKIRSATDYKNIPPVYRLGCTALDTVQQLFQLSYRYIIY
jgi:hypothetical protein